MPVYVYRCKDCGTKFEIFHKTKENLEDNICPSCSSRNANKLMAAASIGNISSTHSHTNMPSCAGPGCQSGMCGLN